jgi:hypothetical protein
MKELAQQPGRRRASPHARTSSSWSQGLGRVLLLLFRVDGPWPRRLLSLDLALAPFQRVTNLFLWILPLQPSHFW